jgi:hypothetical protein
MISKMRVALVSCRGGLGRNLLSHRASPLSSVTLTSKTPKSHIMLSKYSSTSAARSGLSPIHMHISEKNDSNKIRNNKTLVVVAGWMGAKEKQLKPYVSFYNKNGIDVISFSVGPMHILKPESATTQMRNILDEIKKQGETNQINSVCFHHFSVGGYLFGQMLRLLAAESTKYDSVVKTIKGQIFDSPPDINGISSGISKGIGIPVFLQGFVKATIDAYLNMTAKTTGVEHKAASDAFHANQINAPALWFYSKADLVARWQDCETVTGKWESSGIDVTKCMWEHTPHIQHGRKDPDRYFATLEDFLKKIKIL